jgi:hypothetical protein
VLFAQARDISQCSGWQKKGVLIGESDQRIELRLRIGMSSSWKELFFMHSHVDETNAIYLGLESSALEQ